MPSLQIRDLPEDLYIKLCMIAKDENRSLAQQAIVMLRESLGLHVNNKLRRKALIEKLKLTSFDNTSNIDPVDLVRKDRER